MLPSVSGFDHSAFDKSKDDWFTHHFPYKLGNYRKKILTNPINLTTLDYYKKLESISSEDIVRKESILSNGRCDCVVVWVDYQLSLEDNDSITKNWDQGDFNSYMVFNLHNINLYL